MVGALTSQNMEMEGKATKSEETVVMHPNYLGQSEDRATTTGMQ